MLTRAFGLSFAEKVERIRLSSPFGHIPGWSVEAMVVKAGRPFPTVDLRVDYHAPAMPGDLTARGRIIRMGSTFSTCEATIVDASGKLLASGRGTYSTFVKK